MYKSNVTIIVRKKIGVKQNDDGIWTTKYSRGIKIKRRLQKDYKGNLWAVYKGIKYLVRKLNNQYVIYTN